ncbi:hypothetical protein V1281_004736 [Nitrobacteraceae bacterium AZCC 2161]
MTAVATLNIRMIGRAPLLMHAGHLADPLDERAVALAEITSKRAKTRADHEEIGRREWHGGLWLHDQRPCLPAAAVKAALIDAARTKKKGKAAAAGLWVEGPAMLSYDGSTDVRVLWEDPNFRLRTGVRVRDATTMRTRARFPEWSAEVVVTFLASVLNRAEVTDFFQIAGFLVGIGDWRPEYGRFTTVLIE